MGLVQPRHGLWSPLVSTPSSFISSAAANEARLTVLEACQQAPSQALPGVRPVKEASPIRAFRSHPACSTHNIVESYCDSLCFQLSQSLHLQRLSILAPLIGFDFDPASQSAASPDTSSATRAAFTSHLHRSTSRRHHTKALRALQIHLVALYATVAVPCRRPSFATAGPF